MLPLMSLPYPDWNSIMPRYDYMTEDLQYKLTEYNAEAMFDQELSEIYGPITIFGLNYDYARTCRDVDPIAYRCAFLDWADAELIEFDDENPEHIKAEELTEV